MGAAPPTLVKEVISTADPDADTRAPTNTQMRKGEMAKKLIIALVLATTVALAAAPAALAAADLNQVIDNLRVWISSLLAALATLLLLVGGVRYLLAAGDPGAHERAKGAIKTAMVGYALALLAPVLVTIVQRLVAG